MLLLIIIQLRLILPLILMFLFSYVFYDRKKIKQSIIDFSILNRVFIEKLNYHILHSDEFLQRREGLVGLWNWCLRFRRNALRRFWCWRVWIERWRWDIGIKGRWLKLRFSLDWVKNRWLFRVSKLMFRGGCFIWMHCNN